MMKMNPLLTPNDIQRYMDKNRIAGEILRLDVPTPTVNDAAIAVGTQPRQIVKSILFLVETQPVLAVACGNDRIDQRIIAGIYGTGRKSVKLAGPKIVLDVSGYEVGAMPPFAHRERIPTLLDKRVLEQPVVYAGGGAENVLLRLSPKDVLRGTGAQVMDLIDYKAGNS
jgi:prolyl-tRNA editing enzyme YbaK/EbsC (Cys-tRNA(Pro) deacylase)